MLLILFLSAIVAGLVFKKSRICTIYMLIIMYIISAFRTSDADYVAYSIEYNNMSNTTQYRYRGYTSFIKIFKNLGFDFSEYNCFFYLIAFGLLVIAIRLLTNNINAVLACYMIYPYALDTIQMKSCMADALVLISVSIIVNVKSNDNLKHRNFLCFISLISLMLAISMHFSVVFYFLAFIIYFIGRKQENLWVKLVIISSFIIIFLESGALKILIQLANQVGLLSEVDYLMIWTIRSMKLGYLLYVMIICLMFFSISYNKRELIQTQKQREIYIFIVTVILVAPFVYLNGEFSRLLRIYLILIYSIFSNQKSLRNISKERIANGFTCIASVLMLLYLEVLSNYDNVLGALLNNNLFF